MKPGFKFPIVLQVVREAEDGELIPNQDGQMVPLNNKRRNKFWASPSGTHSKANQILCCFAPVYSPIDLDENSKLVELIENRKHFP